MPFDNDYDIPHTNIKFGKWAFCVSGHSHWNTLPEAIRAATGPRIWRPVILIYVLIGF